MDGNDKKKRTTVNEIKKLFYTATRGSVLYIFARKSKALLLQVRINQGADPLLSMKFAEDLARLLKKYYNEADKDVYKTLFE